MMLWVLASTAFLLTLREALLWAGPLPHPLAHRRTEAELDRVSALLEELQETLETGALPEPARWDALGALAQPWGELSRSTVQLLRSRGAPVLPTLRRLRELARSQRSTLGQARARASQALAQAGVCAALVPGAGLALRALLPGVAQRPLLWLGVCTLALALAGAGALWMLKLAERARWGGLSPDERPWMLASSATIERFLAFLRAGEPPDLAWSASIQRLALEAPALARAWGSSAWSSSTWNATPETSDEPLDRVALRDATRTGRLLMAFGSELKRAIQASVFEGRPCSERAEAQLQALQRDLNAQVDRELSLLPTRALKPLFLCIAPALLGLIGTALVISVESSFGDL